MGDTNERLEIRWLQVPGHDAQAEVMSLPKAARDRALAALRRFSLMTHAQFRIKKTYAANIFEAKFVVPQGGLRLLFVYGKTVLWCIGAFIKRNEKDGNKALMSYVNVSKIAEKL